MGPLTVQRAVLLAVAELRISQVVRVWHFGPVAESYPYQAEADAVVIVSEPQG